MTSDVFRPILEAVDGFVEVLDENGNHVLVETPEYSKQISLENRTKLLEEENALLKAQIQAQVDRGEFIEDCIAEMAMQVYSNV